MKVEFGRQALGLLVGIVAVVLSASSAWSQADYPDWSRDDLATLKSLWIGSLPALPHDPTNRVADDPRAIALGQRLFFDQRLSGNGKVACATCHLPALAFTDGKKLGEGVGTAGRNTMTILGTAYSPWLFWDGRKDSLWSQALGPTESPVEHGGSRTQFAHIVADDARYRIAYEDLFGPLPALSDRSRFPAAAGPIPSRKLADVWTGMAEDDRTAVNRTFANLGKAIAAYERKILPGPARFDHYVAALFGGNSAVAREHLSSDAAWGLKMFIGKGQCLKCHNGPLLTNNDFHNTGVAAMIGASPDPGRVRGIAEALRDPFNCFGAFSDGSEFDCGELRYAKTSGAELVGAMRVPTLRSVSKTKPYMHTGQMSDLNTVLRHYNLAPPAPLGTTELTPLGLSSQELKQLKAFLLSLDSPPTVSPSLLAPPE